MPRLEGTILNACVGAEYSSSWTSDGMMIAVGARAAGLADNGDDRHMIELGVGQPV
jgi:hypothetical protein